MSPQEHKCKVCGAAFDTETELEKHNQTMHSRYECGVCGRTLHSESELQIHNRIMHPEETPVR